jgi:ribosomal protein S18 acetylase RimI-like enzyme
VPAGGPAAGAVRTGSGLELQIASAGKEDHRELFELYALVVEEGGAFPREPPADVMMFRQAWIDKKDVVLVARAAGRLAGSYALGPNYPGIASQIANAGYMVHPDFRGRGVGSVLVEHSLTEARRRGFTAMMFNLVRQSNPACSIYERAGFEVTGRVPRAFAGEDALIYWRSL